jgi:hypothetical protein
VSLAITIEPPGQRQPKEFPYFRLENIFVCVKNEKEAKEVGKVVFRSSGQNICIFKGLAGGF